VSCSSQVELKRRDSTKKSYKRDDSANFTQTALKNHYSSGTSIKPQSASNKVRHIRGLSSRLYQVREGTGDVVVLTSKIAGNEDSAGKTSPN